MVMPENRNAAQSQPACEISRDRDEIEDDIPSRFRVLVHLVGRERECGNPTSLLLFHLIYIQQVVYMQPLLIVHECYHSDNKSREPSSILIIFLTFNVLHSH